MSARQTKVLEQARAQIGSSNWSLYTSRTSADGKVTFRNGEYKCNLFVYEMLVAGGVKQELPNGAGRITSFLLNLFNCPTSRPSCASDWYNGKVPNMTYIGQGVNALNKCWPGDIVTDGHYVGIISAPQKTISASAVENKIVENNWGWRKEQWNTVRIFRYHP